MTENLPAKIPVRGGRGIKYSADEVDRALIMLAVSRTPRDAAERLKEQGIIAPSARQVAYWKDQYQDRYVELREKYREDIEKVMVVESMDLAREFLQEGKELLGYVRKQREDGTLRDASAAVQRVITSYAILVDKMMAFEGRPTSVVKHLSGEEALRNLAKYGRVIEGTAEEG
jgi:hypothetical protein